MTPKNNEEKIKKLLRQFQEAWAEGQPPEITEFCNRSLDPDNALQLRFRIEEFLFLNKCIKPESKGIMNHPCLVMETNGERKELGMGDFEIIREIGRGGMGVVYEAKQVSLNRIVALKVLPAHLTLREESVARFKREASTTARLKHPGIVKIHGVGEQKEAHYFAMEFVEGAPLDRVIKAIRKETEEAKNSEFLGRAVLKERHRPSGTQGADEPLSDLWRISFLESVCKIVIQVAEALECAHQSGVIHRDVKPSNILIRKDGVTVLTDFGLAREDGLPSLSMTGDLAGTPHYIAPEQSLPTGKKVDHRADIYSLGVTLFELLTLNKPFTGRTSQEVLGKIITHAPPMLRIQNPSIPKDLETICLTAMEKDPMRRYQSAREFKEDIQRFLQLKPIYARPIGRMKRTYRLIKRNPTASMGVLLLAFVFIVGPLIFAIQQKMANIRITKALKQADRDKAAQEHVSDFLVEIFKIPTPSESRGKTVTAYEILKNGVMAVDLKLKGQPQVRARILEVLGNAHKALGLYSQAKPLYEQALNALVGILGEAHSATIMPRHNLGMAYLHLGEYEKATGLLEQSFEEALTDFKEKDPRIFSIKNNLGTLYKLKCQYNKAERFYLDALKGRMELHGANHDSVSESRNNLAALYNIMGLYEKAKPLYVEAIKWCNKNLGHDHPNTITAVSNLAVSLIDTGRFQEAERLCLYVTFNRFRLMGPEHPSTLETANNLALLYKRTGRFEKAEHLYKQLLKTSRKILKNDHPDTLSRINNLVTVLIDLEKYEEAETLTKEAYEGRRRVLGETHSDTLASLTSRGILFSRKGDYAEAEKIYTQLLKAQAEKVGPFHPNTLFAKNNLATILYRQGRFEPSRALFEQTLKECREHVAKGHMLTPLVLSNFANLYFAKGELSKAEALAKEALEKTNPKSFHYKDRQSLYENILKEKARR